LKSADIELGLFDFAHGLPIYTAEDATVEGIDIAGVAKTFDMARKTVDAYAPVLAAAFEKKYGARVLNYYTWPSQMFYCNSAIKGLADIKGKKVRVQGTSQGDLVEALGATGVTIPFAEVVPALQRGTVDCGITGTMPAFKAGWHEVTSHVLKLPVGFSVSFTVVSLATWGKLDDKTKAFMESTVKGQTDQWWKTIIDEDTMGLNCTTGTGECTAGKPGKLVKVEPTPDDAAILETAMKDVVLKRWAKRCGSDASCISNWNDTIGKVVGLTATQ
jgi:TRAP-type mannitol/chloroaromatic compound transport system substrate-binding protein